MNIEICTDCVEGALIAEKHGAKRIELCAALSVGGLTPSYGLISQCILNSTIEIHALIRPREGDFQYSNEALKVMKIDIEMAKRAGAEGVVFGILNDKNEVSDSNLELVKFAKSLTLEVTFHRAFDYVVDFKKAIEKMKELKKENREIKNRLNEIEKLYKERKYDDNWQTGPGLEKIDPFTWFATDIGKAAFDVFDKLILMFALKLERLISMLLLKLFKGSIFNKPFSLELETDR